MKAAAKELDFEKAAAIRDEIRGLRELEIFQDAEAGVAVGAAVGARSSGSASRRSGFRLDVQSRAASVGGVARGCCGRCTELRLAGASSIARRHGRSACSPQPRTPAKGDTAAASGRRGRTGIEQGKRRPAVRQRHELGAGRRRDARRAIAGSPTAARSACACMLVITSDRRARIPRGREAARPRRRPRPPSATWRPADAGACRSRSASARARGRTSGTPECRARPGCSNRGTRTSARHDHTEPT